MKFFIKAPIMLLIMMTSVGCARILTGDQLVELAKLQDEAQQQMVHARAETRANLHLLPKETQMMLVFADSMMEQARIFTQSKDNAWSYAIKSEELRSNVFMGVTKSVVGGVLGLGGIFAVSDMVKAMNERTIVNAPDPVIVEKPVVYELGAEASAVEEVADVLQPVVP